MPKRYEKLPRDAISGSIFCRRCNRSYPNTHVESVWFDCIVPHQFSHLICERCVHWTEYWEDWMCLFCFGEFCNGWYTIPSEDVATRCILSPHHVGTHYAIYEGFTYKWDFSAKIEEFREIL